MRAVKPFASSFTITKGDKSVDLKKLMALMGMGIKCGDTVDIKVEGPDEDAAAEALEKLFKENL